jgi:hypothetical protein
LLSNGSTWVNYLVAIGLTREAGHSLDQSGKRYGDIPVGALYNLNAVDP